MQSSKFQFENTQGEQLVGRLDFPVNQHPHTFVLFAHCFTCNKSLTAVRNISRELTLEGFAVLRFDFTGLGESEGDFADTNFSSNVEDLLQAAEELKRQHQAPAVLVGHSLGGAAVIKAACELDYVKAVVAIGAPFSPSHVSHLLDDSLSELQVRGEAKVQIGGRPFTVKKQFLEDIREHQLGECLERLKKGLLIMHSPQDKIVEIENAAKMYQAARHPKSFVTLDGADHLLSHKKDSKYAGDMIATWARKYLTLPEKEALEVEKEVAVRLGNEGFTTEIMMGKHSLTADEPESVGGNDFGPSPYDLLSASLGACTSMTLQMYARRKKWDLQEVVVHLEHYKDHIDDAQETEDPKSKLDHFDRIIELEGDLDEEQRAKLLEIANKCPVHRTLHSDIKVNTRLQD
ncbi:MAG TPA: alpha/beta fold hydrolase [Saprospiraceae bacterium]|nr:alpha/beta fold hydrolase [Saprospiraceae bacterium]